MFKMMAIDVDDTLINDQKKISLGTRKALAAAISQGVIITLATGRMYASAQQLAEQLCLNVPLITYQGALIKNAIDGHVLYERNVPIEASVTIFHFCEVNKLHLQTYIDDVLYVKEDNEKARKYAKLSNIPYTVYPEFNELAVKNATKLLIIDDPSILDDVARNLRTLIKSKVHITKSKPHFLEIMHSEGTKGHAITYLAKYFNLDLSKVISIGDSWNDHEMLEVSGLGVAMGNAVDSLKEIADYITLSNNEEGVKHVLNKFILHPISNS